MMKKRIGGYLWPIVALCLISANTAHAQHTPADTTEDSKMDFTPTLGKKDYDDRGEEIRYPRVFGGLTFTRIDWGFSRLIDDGSFNLSPDNQYLDYKKASNFGFDIAQIGLRFNDQFKMYLSTGFEWNYLRLKNDIIFDQDGPTLSYSESDINYKKNILTSTYLRVPLSFEFRTRKNKHGERAKIAFGAMTGILLKGTQRLKSEELGKQKYRDNYHLASFQYGLFARVGFGAMGVFTKYYLNDMFENTPTAANVNNFTFGLTLGF